MSQAKPGSWRTTQEMCLSALDKAGQGGSDPNGREVEEAMKYGDKMKNKQCSLNKATESQRMIKYLCYFL